MSNPTGPDAASEQDVKVYRIDPGGDHADPLSQTGIVAVKWLTKDGEHYGEAMYLPPVVAAAFWKAAKTIEDTRAR